MLSAAVLLALVLPAARFLIAQAGRRLLSLQLTDTETRAMRQRATTGRRREDHGLRRGTMHLCGIREQHWFEGAGDRSLVAGS